MDYSEFVRSRKNYIGASDAPVIMGVSPWRTPYQLWEDKLDLAPEQEDTFALRRGRELEPVAREAYSVYTGHIVEPKQVFHPEIPYMMANMDGITDDHSIAVEIKCPGEADHQTAKQGIVPEKYRPQLQHQLAVIGINQIHYFSYRDGDTALVEVERDEGYIKRLLLEEKKFWSCVENLSAPSLTDRDYAERNDSAWANAASEWTLVSKQLEELKLKEKLHRETLIQLAGEHNCIGNKVKLQKILRKGTVDYKAVPELKDVDVEKYRKQPTESWRIVSC
jgi:putative phage-type endonuclease